VRGKIIRLAGAVLVAIVLLAGVYRFWQILPYPVGTGEAKKSPSGRYEAAVTDYYDETFFGGKKRWFQFEIRGDSQKMLITDAIDGPYFGSRSSTSVIQWASDESNVVFSFPAVEIRMIP